MRKWILHPVSYAFITGILTLTLVLILPSKAAAVPVMPAAISQAKQPAYITQHTISELHKVISSYKVPKLGPVYYKVQPNDTLAAIAAKQYGSASYWPVIYLANKSKISDYNVIFQGQKLKIPVKPKHIPSIPSIPVTNQPVSSGNSPAPSVSGTAGRAVAYVYAQLGCPYVWGGNGPCNSGYDCSGLMQQAWLYAGVSIPRVSWDQMASEPSVSLNALEPGDILGMYGNSHVGMYVGGGMMIDAPVPGAVVEKVPVPWGVVDGAVRP